MTDVPRSKQFDDVYFSVQDGLAESRHVFLAGNNLPEHWEGRGEYTICETGFGTGLNFLAVYMLWLQSDPDARPKKLHFISFEKYPLSKSEIEKHLTPWQELESLLAESLAVYPSDINDGIYNISISDGVKITLIFGDMNDTIHRIETPVDCWFLDGFKPSSNPDMWSETLFENMARLSAPNATISTFTAAGFVKRGLQNAGFEITKVPGFGRKREMITGKYSSN